MVHSCAASILRTVIDESKNVGLARGNSGGGSGRPRHCRRPGDRVGCRALGDDQHVPPAVLRIRECQGAGGGQGERLDVSRIPVNRMSGSTIALGDEC